MSELTLVRPDAPLTPTIARLSQDNGRLRLYFPEKRDDFREVAHYLQYRWNGDAFYKQVEDDVVNDRAAELIRDLLAAGFCVKAPSAWVAMALEGTFQEEPRRTIKADMTNNLLAIWWQWGEAGENEAKKLPGAKFVKGAYRTMTVPAEQYAAVRDFAELHGFSISAKAEEMMKKAEKELCSALVANIKAGQRKAPIKDQRKPNKLTVQNVGIDHDLLDV